MRIPLLANGTRTGEWLKVGGGRYKHEAEAAVWNGAEVSIEQKGPNGTATMIQGTTLSKNDSVDFTVAGETEIRAVVAVAVPTGLYSNVATI